VGTLASNILIGQLVTITNPITLTGFGLFGNQPAGGLQGVMALYSNVGGAPSALVALTAPTAIVDGNNVLPVLAPGAVAAGTYWIAAAYNATASICTATSSTNPLDFVNIAFPNLPNNFGAAGSDGTAILNYYVIGTE
jgi:hypothetical protein